jgi:hypothetical protein
MKRVVLTLMLAMLSSNAAAAWVQIGENDRWVAYADTEAIHRSGNLVVSWTLFDYKSTQESRGGKRYLSEKSQREVDCQSERLRVLFFTWHASQRGNGIVVYTGDKPTNWEPTSSPGSIAGNIWKFVCGKK